MKGISLLLAAVVSFIGSLFTPHSHVALSSQNLTQQEQSASPQNQHIYTDDELLSLASNQYANGVVPLGDNKYVTDAPKKGYIYLCHAQSNGQGGAGTDGPWIGKTTWNFLQKVSVSGSVSWPNAQFSNVVRGSFRVLFGNDLPINYTTGVFPIQATDAAYKYDRNPNKISVQNIRDEVAANPTYSDSAYCMGGEVGVMLSGVALFNGFDAGLRDAPAHELQDSCSGHPQESGEYHYHSLSTCFKDINEKTVLGYALDGFPITGPEVAPGKYLTTDNLDECHGITSEIIEDGKKVITYHYVMTQDFPYSASCFRAKPINPAGIGGGRGPQNVQQSGMTGNQNRNGNSQGHTPPQEAITACRGKSQGTSCSFTSPRGDTISGSYGGPGENLACIPSR